MAVNIYRDTAPVYQANHWEDTDLLLMARVRGADAVDILEATISSISVKVYDLQEDEQVLTTLAPVVADAVYDTLQTGGAWTKDSVGYNFAYTVPAAYFPEGDRDYRVEVRFTPTTGSSFPLVWEISVKNLEGS